MGFLALLLSMRCERRGKRKNPVSFILQAEKGCKDIIVSLMVLLVQSDAQITRQDDTDRPMMIWKV